VRAVHADCERARQWASADVDGELSPFEQVVLEGHLADCPSCREFRAGVSGLAQALRVAPNERLERRVEVARRRRRVGLRLAPAAAAMAIAAVGLGSILASSQFRSGSVGTASLQSEAASASAAPDTLDLRTAEVLQRAAAMRARLEPRAPNSLRGGPVVRER
jgi:predicted anti-sigma-YlaC factor YlaD